MNQNTFDGALPSKLVKIYVKNTTLNGDVGLKFNQELIPPEKLYERLIESRVAKDKRML